MHVHIPVNIYEEKPTHNERWQSLLSTTGSTSNHRRSSVGGTHLLSISHPPFLLFPHSDSQIFAHACMHHMMSGVQEPPPPLPRSLSLRRSSRQRHLPTRHRTWGRLRNQELSIEHDNTKMGTAAAGPRSKTITMTISAKPESRYIRNMIISTRLSC